MAVGWIKLHRKTLDSQAFSDPDLFRLWCYMLLRANYKPSFFRGEPIGIGQFAFTQRLLCDALAVSKGKIHRDLQKLVEMGSIAIKAGREFSVATICNWETYQDSSDETGAQDGRSGGDDGAAAGRSAGANGPLPKKERSKEPPPPTPSTDAEPAAASWEGVGDVLKSIKLGQRRELVEQLRQDGATPAAVLAIVEHWQSQPGAWEVGGLVLRLQRWAPGQAADDGFPPPSEAYQRDEARRRRLADSKRVAIETLANRAKFFADRQAAVESRKQEAVA